MEPNGNGIFPNDIWARKGSFFSCFSDGLWLQKNGKGVNGLQKTANQKVINYRKPSLGRTLNQNKTLLLMCLPAIVFFFIFSYLPMPGAYIAFTNFKYDKGIFGSDFVGLRNFEFLFISGQLGLLLKNTIL